MMRYNEDGDRGLEHVDGRGAPGNSLPSEDGTTFDLVAALALQIRDFTMGDEEELLKALNTQFSGKANNVTLRNALKWEQDRYFVVRNLLIDSGLVRKAHGGPGGSTFAVVPPESDANSLVPEAESPLLPGSQEKYPNEGALYEPMLRQIEKFWTIDERYDSSLCRMTGLAGGKNTGGKWTRPDITVVAVQKFKFLRDPVLDVISFEIKPIGKITVEGIFQALAHRQYTNRAYVIFHTDEENFNDQSEKDRIETLAEQSGIGLILAEDPDKYETWIERVRAKRWVPDPQDLNAFIGQTFPDPADQDTIIKMVK
jgi:hypothetical protein